MERASLSHSPPLALLFSCYNTYTLDNYKKVSFCLVFFWVFPLCFLFYAETEIYAGRRRMYVLMQYL